LRLRDFHSIKFRPADSPNCRSVSREKLLRAPQSLRLRLRLSSYPPAQRWHLREAAPPSDSPLPLGADKRLPPLIVPVISVLIVLVVWAGNHNYKRQSVLPVLLYQQRVSTHTHVVVYMVVLLLLGILILIDISACRRNSASVVCEGQCMPSVVEHSLRAGGPSRCEGRKRSAALDKPPQGRLFQLAGFIMLLDVGQAATEEQLKGERYERLQPLPPPLRSIVKVSRLSSYHPPAPGR